MLMGRLILEMKCLKPKYGSGDVVGDTPKHLPEDIGDFSLCNIIAGPLVVTPKGSTQFIVVKNYLNVSRIFEEVKKVDRKLLCV